MNTNILKIKKKRTKFIKDLHPDEPPTFLGPTSLTPKNYPTPNIK